MKRYAGQVHYCYANSLVHRPALEGELSVLLRVYSGTVANVLVLDNAIGDQNLEACVVRKLRRWHFSEKVDADIILPFSMKPTSTVSAIIPG